MTAALVLPLLVATAAMEGPAPDASDGGASSAAARDGGSDAAPAGPEVAAAPPPLPTGSLTGRVLGKGTRRPVPAAALTLGTTPLGETDADGQFSFEVLCGRARLTVQAPAFDMASIDVDPCATPAPAPLVVRLEPSPGAPRYETRVVASPPSQPVVPIEAEELTKTPGSLGDPFRVIESLPGVATVQWPAPVYAVRGANPGNTGFFLDDMRVPALFHFALGPSVIHPYFFDRLDFYPGGYPARYGRYVAGIVSAETRQPPDDAVHGVADVRLFDAGALISAPFPDGNGTVAVAGRYSYTGALVSLLNDDVTLGYWDYQLRAERRLGPLRVTLLLLGSGDHLAPKGDDESEKEVLLRFHRAQLRAELPAGDGRLGASVTAGTNHSKSPLADRFPITVDSVELDPRLYYRRAGTYADIDVGAEGVLAHYDPVLSIDRPEAVDLVRARAARLLAAYASVTLRAGRRLSLTPELRVDSYAEGGASATALGPRLALRVGVGADTYVNFVGGRFTQMPSLPVEVPGAENFGLGTYGLQRSWQGALGVETAHFAELEAKVSGYVQRGVLTDVRNPSLSMVDPLAPDFLAARDDLSYGVEVLLRRPQRLPLHGWLAYTLSVSQRALPNGVVAPSDWDQRHILNLVLGYRMGRNTCGGRAHLNTGRPYTHFGASDPSNPVRLPTYYQIDLRCDRRYVFDRLALELYIELQNATFSRQVISFRSEDAMLSAESVRIVLPSIGVHAEF